MTYSRSGFELRKKSGQTYVWSSKIGEILISPTPNNVEFKEVATKQEPSGEWYVSFSTTTPWDDLSEKPQVEDIDEDDKVGIDIGVLSFAYTSDGVAFERLTLDDKYDRLAHEQRSSVRKKKGRTIGRRNAGRLLV